MGYNRNLVGKSYPAKRLLLSPATGAAFVAATCDVNPLYPQTVLPPWIICVLTLPEGVAQVVRDPHLHDDPEHFARLLHYREDMRWHRPVVADEPYDLQPTLQAVQPHAMGSLVQVRCTLRNAGGALVSESITTLFTHERLEAASPAEKPPRLHPVTDPTWRVQWEVAADQPERYAAASADDNAIHLSDVAAQQAGLKRRILHGMCTLAFAGRALVAAVCGNDPRRLSRLTGQFARPVYPGDTLMWAAAQRQPAVEFAVSNQQGKVVIGQGLAEVVR